MAIYDMIAFESQHRVLRHGRRWFVLFVWHLSGVEEY